MEERKPHPANVPGGFYVEDGCCLMCGVPFREASDLFGGEEADATSCFVKRQPETPNDLAKMVRTLQCADMECIRYRGDDRRIQLALVEAGCGILCDTLPDDLKARMGEVAADKKRRYEERIAEREAIAKKANQWWKFWLNNP